MRVPWNALSSKPVQLEIQGLHLLLEPLANSDWPEFVNAQNKFEVLEQLVLQHAVVVF